MPRIDDGPADGPPGRPLKSAWVTLSPSEGHDLAASLEVWAEEVTEGNADPGWHTHITDSDGNELTIAISATGAGRVPS